MPEDTAVEAKKDPYDFVDPDSLDKKYLEDTINSESDDVSLSDGETPAEEPDAAEPEAEPEPAPEAIEPEAEPEPDGETDEEPPAVAATELGMRKIEDYLDEELAGVVQTLKDQVVSLRRQLDEFADRERKTADQKRSDDLIKSHAGEYSAFLEDQPAKDRVFNAMSVLKAGYEAVGQTAPDEATLLRRALRQEFGDSVVESQQKKISDSVKKRESQIISRGAANLRGEGSPADRAAQAVRRRMAEKGLL